MPKVLLLSIFHPELVRGGAQQICYELFQGLKATEDWRPVLLAAIDPTMDSLYKTGARITGFDGRDGEFLFLCRDYDYLWHRAPNELLIESFREFLEWTKPDVLHFHHFLLFGVDLLTVARRALPSAKIVLTFHEFIAICAADGQMVRPYDKSRCERATPVRCHQCFPEHGPEHFFLREQWIKRHLESADMFTVPSRFMLDRYARWGVPRERIVHIPNGQMNRNVTVEAAPSRGKRNRFGFFGQFVDNKGVHVLLEAVSLLRADGFTDFAVELNGDNMKYASPERRAEIERFLAEEAERPAAERLVTFNGSYEVDQLTERMSRIDWCVVPSTWSEAFGLVISEAWMFRRPVIGSRVGAIAERVRHGEDGLLFTVADPRALADQIRRAATEDGLWDRLSAKAPSAPSQQAMVEDYVSLYDDLLGGLELPRS